MYVCIVCSLLYLPIVILTYNRVKTLYKVIENVAKAPSCVMVRTHILCTVWCHETGSCDLMAALLQTCTYWHVKVWLECCQSSHLCNYAACNGSIYIRILLFALTQE